MRAAYLRASMIGMAATLAVLGALGAAASVTAAATRSGAMRSTPTRAAVDLPSVDTVQIGPISAADGFSLYISEQGCGSSSPYFQVDFITTSGSDVLSHTYTGAVATCSILRSKAGAQLRASLPGAININARIGGVANPLAHPGLPAGCGAPYGPELPATATGRIDVAIHPAIFGRYNESKVSAQIFSGAPQHCPAIQSTTGRELTADVGSYIINAAAPAHGTPQLDIYDAFGDSSPSGLTGALQLEVDSPQAYGVTSPSGAARLSVSGPLATGGMTFSPLPACPGDQAQDGTLAGTLTINDPLLGGLAINGAYADQAFSGLGTAQAGTCNGPGSEMVAPSIISSCDQVNFACSVAGGTNTVTFFDETNPGTQSITAEAVDFGDGSPVVPIANFGSVEHTYAQAGTYTVTLGVRDAVGTTTSATDEVDIEP